MSQSQQTQQQSPYRRDDWFGDNKVESSEQTTDEITDGRESYESRRIKWVVHDILKSVATLACPIALNAPPNRPAALWEWLERGEAKSGHDRTAMHRENEIVELTEPELWLPLESQETIGGKPIEYGQRQHRTRYNPEHGYPVGPQILDVDFETFMQVARMVLDHLEMSPGVGLSSRERDKLDRDAERLKKAGNRHDNEILETIIEDAIGVTSENN